MLIFYLQDYNQSAIVPEDQKIPIRRRLSMNDDNVHLACVIFYFAFLSAILPADQDE